MDEIDREMKEFQEKPQFDINSVIPKLTDDEREKYRTKDGTINYLAYEKDKGKLQVISEKGDRELNSDFKKIMVGFFAFIGIVLVGFAFAGGIL